VTSATRPLAQVRLRAAGLPAPKNLITATDITHGKPHPEPYLKAAQILGFPARDCVVVEDVPAGIKSGKAAGARVIALTTTASPSNLVHAGADWILQNCADIRLLPGTGELQLVFAEVS
jgi:beta-phosphoglucomutase-like phosphatase (HAD superfamily)